MAKKAKRKRSSDAKLLSEMVGEPEPSYVTLDPTILARVWRDEWADDIRRDMNQTIAETIGSNEPVDRARRARALSALHWIEAAIQAIKVGNAEAAALAGVMCGIEQAGDCAAYHFPLARRGLSYIESARRKVETTAKRDARIRAAFRDAKQADPKLTSSKWLDDRIAQEESMDPSKRLVTNPKGEPLSKSRVRTICKPRA